MKIKVLLIGKTDQAWVREGLEIYLDRLRHYTGMEWLEIPAPKTGKSDEQKQKKAEGELILKNIQPSDRVILLDERGKETDSPGLAQLIQQQMNSGLKQLVLVIGGAYGFSEEVYARSDMKLSLSRLTFSHQMVRVFLAEQVYRAFTILKGESYHHK
ncbi:MAG: 23S rRNA (pseudouridine1915-N3)-methyltransferase [Bacteroidetes bacterium]|nr:MAG: 23S rRNA (pseudouridine1915-N3)-methyltransferase [Bacteroidota bacterium]